MNQSRLRRQWSGKAEALTCFPTTVEPDRPQARRVHTSRAPFTQPTTLHWDARSCCRAHPSRWG